MPIIDNDSWQKCVNGNKDFYGKCCVDVAREVMALLDERSETVTPQTVHQLIMDGEHRAGESGITGFMAGCIASMVSHCHSRGEEFRKAWNADWGIGPEQDRGGVVNPALVVIDTEF